MARKRTYRTPGIHFTPEEEREMARMLARYEAQQNEVKPSGPGRIRAVKVLVDDAFVEAAPDITDIAGQRHQNDI